MTDQPSVTPWAPPVGGVRLARAVASSLVVTAAAAAAHLTNGGRADETVVASLLAVLAPVCWLLTARRLSTGQLLGLLAVAQAFVHVSCSGSDPMPGGAMLAGHVVATLVSLAVLRRGERVLLALADRVVARWILPAVRLVRTSTVLVAPAHAVRVVRGRVLVVGERAPPVAA